MLCCIGVLLYSGRGTGIGRCIALSTAMQHDFSYSRLYSAEALRTAHRGADTTVDMVAWEPGWVRVTPPSSHMARVTQKTIGKRQTGISGALGLPSVAASMAILYIQPALQQYTTKSCCIGQYSARSLSERSSMHVSREWCAALGVCKTAVCELIATQ